jgi:hypothetical protein
LSGILQAPRGDGHHKEEAPLKRLLITTSGYAVSCVGVLKLPPPPPFGIYQVSRRNLIDCGVVLASMNLYNTLFCTLSSIGVLAAVLGEPNIHAAVSPCGFIAKELRFLR